MRAFTLIIGLLLLCHEALHAQSLKAICGPDVTIKLGEAVTLDGSASRTSAGHRMASASWDFDNLDNLKRDFNGLKVAHYYNQVGSYNAVLTIKDETGRTDQAIQRIEVLSPADWGPTLVDRFEGGRSGAVNKGEADFCFRNQWGLQWYIRLDNVAGVPISLKIYGYGPERKVPPSVTPYADDQSFDEKFIPYVNYDFSNPRWERLQDAKLTYEAATCSLTLRHQFSKSPVYLAWSPPYASSDLERFLARLPESSLWHADTAGKSVEGRDIKLITVTDPKVPNLRKRTIWLISQQHGYEMAGGPICEGIVRTLLDEGIRHGMLEHFIFKLVPIMNPDAMAHGGFRYNMHDVDLNRNWDTESEGYADRAAPEPEVACVKRALEQWIVRGNRLDLFIDMHCHTPLSDGLWIYPMDSTLVSPEINRRQMEFARDYLNRVFQFSIEPFNPKGCACYFVSRHYSSKTGVLSYTTENPLLKIRTTRGENLLTTPEVYRSVGHEMARSMIEYFSQKKN